LKPKAIIANPRGTRPDSLLSNGHDFAKYDLKRETSETMRNSEIEDVMKWDTPSKKKN
jgi:hypothetical protein